jgi:hypothetical protein
MLALSQLGAVAVLAICLPLSAALLGRVWLLLSESYRLAPAGRHAKAGFAAKEVKHSAFDTRLSLATAWRPILYATSSWVQMIYLPWLFLAGMTGGSSTIGFAVAML